MIFHLSLSSHYGENSSEENEKHSIVERWRVEESHLQKFLSPSTFEAQKDPSWFFMSEKGPFVRCELLFVFLVFYFTSCVLIQKQMLFHHKTRRSCCVFSNNYSTLFTLNGTENLNHFSSSLPARFATT